MITKEKNTLLANYRSIAKELLIVDGRVFASQLYQALGFSPRKYWGWLKRNTVCHKINSGRREIDYFFINKEQSAQLTGQYRINCSFTLPFAKEIVIASKSERKNEVYEYLNTYTRKSEPVEKDELLLISQESFNGISCNVYKDHAGDYLLTREQIGQALEYNDPQKAISNIHTRHKERLDKYSVVLKLRSTDNKEYETHLYMLKGILEICRYSHQPKADAVMDWTWSLVRKYFSGELNAGVNHYTNTMLLNKIENIESTLKKLLPYLTNKAPERKYSSWKSNIYKDADLLARTLNTDINSILHHLYVRWGNMYGRDSLNELKDEYLTRNNLRNCSTLEAIEANQDAKEVFRELMNEVLKKYDLLDFSTQYIKQTIFDN